MPPGTVVATGSDDVLTVRELDGASYVASSDPHSTNPNACAAVGDGTNRARTLDSDSPMNQNRGIMQLSLLPDAVLLHRIDPGANMRRYYSVRLAPDLFGGCALVREWGRIRRSCSRRIELFEDEGRAQDRLLDLHRAKASRGYVAIG